MFWTDNHCHLPEDADDATALVEECLAAGVTRLVTVGCDVASSLRALDNARRFPGTVWATAGIHPHDAKDGGLEAIAELLGEPEVVAVGEAGFDLHYNHSPREVQAEVFAAQIRLAHDHDTALVIHTRNAWSETFEVLEAEGVPARTVFHCFSGGPAEAERCLELGTFLSFSGIVSFPSAPELREAAQICPLDRLLVETDSPYLAPVPFRGKKNRPALVTYVGAAVAEAKNVQVADVAKASQANAEALFGARLAP